MKTFYILLILTVFTKAQQFDYFQSFYPQLTYNTQIQDVHSTDSSFELIIHDGDLFYYDLSKEGDLLQTQNLSINYTDGYRSLHKDKLPIKFLPNSYISSLELVNEESNVLYLSLYDDEFNQTNRIALDTLRFIVNPSYMLDVADNDRLVVFYKYHTNTYKLKIFNSSELSEGSEIEKTFKLKSSGFSNFNYAIENSHGNTFISSPQQITKLSSTYDTLWTKKNYNWYIQKLLAFESNIIVVFEDSLTCYDSNGSELWHLNPNLFFRDVIISTSGKIIFVGYQGIEYYSMEGLFLGKQSTSFDINFIQELAGGSIFMSGGDFMAVTGPDGMLHKELIFTSQMSPKEHFTSEKIEIRWINIANEYIDLFYSIDEGNSWNNIVDYYPANWGFYWDPPYEEINNIIIKVSANDDQNVFDISDASVSIRIFDEYAALAGNNIYMWLGNNGLGSHNPYNDDSGLFWPGGNAESVNTVFADGLVWGGIVDNEIRVNGNTYANGLQPGKITAEGTADYPYQTDYKIYKLKNNWELEQPGKERERYKYDYKNWPGHLSAPYTDVDNDGLFTRGIDLPKVIGEETVFYVANDLDTAASKSTYGSDPIGLEFTTTSYAYGYPLDNVVFKEYIVINKSNKIISDMYFAYWADIELGCANDDYIGCDTALSLAYGYNSDNYDDDSYGALPPAAGHMLLQGPVVSGSDTDSAKFFGKFVSGLKNLSMTSFTPNFKLYGDLPNDPMMGDYRGTIMFYDIMHGLSDQGDSIINPHTGKGTIFALSGDPEKGTGWYEGEGWPDGPVGGDRRYTMSSGPFNMAPGDTQHVVYAILVARGSDHINSVTKLKELAKTVHEWYGNEIITGIKEAPSLPNEFKLYQNYPNPFNPTTTIEYEIPSLFSPLSGEAGGGLKAPTSRGDFAKIRLVIYDILGREVASLVDKEQKPGRYKVMFEASHLSSGVYFYNIRYGDRSISKKMLLIK